LQFEQATLKFRMSMYVFRSQSMEFILNQEW